MRPDLPILDPLIDALLDRLPAPGDPWPRADRQLWLEILVKSFDLIYPEENTDAARDLGSEQHPGA